MGCHVSFDCNAYKTAYDAAHGYLSKSIKDKKVYEFAKEMKKCVGSYADIAKEDPFCFLCFSDYEWNNCEKDMLFLSKKYPDYYYRIDAVGESQFDMWRAIFHNGKVTKSTVKILWPDFMLSKLD